MPKARDLIEARFGTRIDWNEDPEVATAELASARFLRAFPDRLQFTIMNLGATAIFIRTQRRQRQPPEYGWFQTAVWHRSPFLMMGYFPLWNGMSLEPLPRLRSIP